MRSKFILIILLVSSLAIGCAHSQNPTAINRLQIKVAQLEKKVADRDKEINDLKYSMQDLNGQMNEIETYSLNEPVEEYDYRKTSRRVQDFRFDSEEEEEELQPARTTKDDERVIRVSASARDIQKALKNAGYYTGKIDGRFGKQSRRALSKFQSDHNLVRDGIVGKRTWIELKTYLD